MGAYGMIQLINGVKSNMYSPKFNSVLVEIDDKDAEWGSENSESMLGKSFSKGTIIATPKALINVEQYRWFREEEAADMALQVAKLKGKQIMWNEGAEAGTTFEEDGKLYGFIYWYDIRGCKDD